MLVACCSGSANADRRLELVGIEFNDDLWLSDHPQVAPKEVHFSLLARLLLGVLLLLPQVIRAKNDEWICVQKLSARRGGFPGFDASSSLQVETSVATVEKLLILGCSATLDG